MQALQEVSILRKCERCGGTILSDYYELFCVNCGHRLRWSDRPSEMTSTMGTFAAGRPRDPFLGRHASPAKLQASQTLPIELEDGSSASLTFVQLSKKLGTLEDFQWYGRHMLPTERQMREISILFKTVTGLALRGLMGWCRQQRDVPGNDRRRQWQRARENGNTFLAVHANVSQAARDAGISRPAVYVWREKSDAFRAKWDDAIEEAIDAIELAVTNAALQGDMQTARWFLSRRRPQVWGDKLSLEHSGKDGGPIQVDVAAIEAKIRALGETEG